MKRSVSRFRGCLKGIYKGYVDEQLIEYMIENEIIFADKNIENCWGSPHYMKIRFPLSYEKQTFYPNNDILLDIYEVLRVGNDSRPVQKNEISAMDEIRLIDKKIFMEYSTENKLNALKEYRKNIVDKMIDYSGYIAFTEDSLKHPYNENLSFYNQKNYFNWKVQILQIILKDYNAIKNYLLEDFGLYIHNDAEEESNNLFSSNHSINKIWRNNRRSAFLIRYIENKINELKVKKNETEVYEKKDNQNKSIIKGVKGSTALYIVMFMNILWHQTNKDTFDDKKLTKYIGHLTGMVFYDKQFQLKRIKEFLNIDKINYDCLTATDFGKYFHDITNKDLKQFQRLSAVLTKESKKYSPEQKKMFEKKDEIEEKIHSDLSIIDYQ